MSSTEEEKSNYSNVEVIGNEEPVCTYISPLNEFERSHHEHSHN